MKKTDEAKLVKFRYNIDIVSYEFEKAERELAMCLSEVAGLAKEISRISRQMNQINQKFYDFVETLTTGEA